MGSSISSCHYAGKLVLPDGGVQELAQPVAVAELMLDHPQHMVVEFRPSSAARLPPLPADLKLDPNGVYLMVPMARGKASGVSAEEARRMIMASGRARMIRPMKIPLVGMCIVGATATREEMLRDRMDDRKTVGPKQAERPLALMEGCDGGAEFIRRQCSSKGWKPSLGAIAEMSFEKIPHWLFYKKRPVVC